MAGPIIIANWKLAGGRQAYLRLLQKVLARLPIIPGAEIVICAPPPYLQLLGDELVGRPLALGAANISLNQQPLPSGEISAAMLADCRCRYILLGLAERRGLPGEADADLVAKIISCQQRQLTAVLCLEETLEQRRSQSMESNLQQRLAQLLRPLKAAAVDKLVLAYQPSWATEGGFSLTPEQVQEVHAFIRQQLQHYCTDPAQVPILFGGQVGPQSAAQLLAQSDIDGLLLGEISEDDQSFVRICVSHPGP